jgi:hypothetical protein
MEATQRSAEVNARATTPQSLITEAQRLALDVEELVTKCVDEVPCLPDSDSQALGCSMAWLWAHSLVVTRCLCACRLRAMRPRRRSAKTWSDAPRPFWMT